MRWQEGHNHNKIWHLLNVTNRKLKYTKKGAANQRQLLELLSRQVLDYVEQLLKLCKITVLA